MADFYTVLMNSLRKRNIADPATRERVYLRARMALIRKLWGQRPRMSDREIEDEVAVFDLAVGLVESDVAESLPAPRRQRQRREKAARIVWEQAVPDIKFDITEHEVEAESDPEEADRLAYRTHLREAASRANDWAESMVQRIDPVTVARAALASPPLRPVYARMSAVAAGPVHETVLAESVIDMSMERTVPTQPGRRTFRSFFSQRSAPKPAGFDTGVPSEPTRLQEYAQRILVFFEQLSERLYEGSVAAHRQRRGRLTPRVYIRPPTRPATVELLQKRRRRQLAARLAAPLAVIGVVAIVGWLGAEYQTEITAKFDELTSASAPVEEIEVPAGPKVDDADAIETMPQADIVLFDGRDPSAFQGTANKPVVAGSDAAGGYVRIQAPALGEDGARLVISSGIADRLARKTVRIVVTARSPVDDGAGTIRLGYRAGNETGPFAAQPLGREYRRLEISWTIPGGSSLGEHALFIEPGLLGGGSTVDVKAVEIFLDRQPDQRRDGT
jgi:hypothetical protein